MKRMNIEEYNRIRGVSTSSNMTQRRRLESILSPENKRYIKAHYLESADTILLHIGLHKKAQLKRYLCNEYSRDRLTRPLIKKNKNKYYFDNYHAKQKMNVEIAYVTIIKVFNLVQKKDKEKLLYANTIRLLLESLANDNVTKKNTE
jgi:hypothetical protein